jgi:hypothetical protein
MSIALDEATLAAALDVLVTRYPREVHRALSVKREQARRRYDAQCPVCGVRIQGAHDRQVYCSPPCSRRAQYLKLKESRANRRRALRGDLPPLPEPPRPR